MNSYIKGIALFRDNTEDGRRFVVLTRGLNIITGHSKTGKSALLDIVDWCLGANSSTIPKGKITEFAKVYAIIIEIKGISLLLARKDGSEGNNSIHVNIIPPNMTIESIRYANLIDAEYKTLKHAFTIIGNIIDGKNEYELNFNNDHACTQIRDSLCFIYQDQGIIDSKINLFYKDPKKNMFPVLAGWYDNDYFLTKKRIKEIDDKLKKEDKAIPGNTRLENNLKNALRAYYGLIGVDFNDEWDIRTCLERIKNLESFDKILSSNKLVNRQEELEAIIDKLQSEEQSLYNQKSRIRSSQLQADNYKSLLNRFKEREKYITLHKESICPICSQHVNEMCIEGIEILEAQKWVSEELISIPIQKDEFALPLKSIEKRLHSIAIDLGKLRSEHRNNKKILIKVKENNSINEIRELTRLRVLSEAEIYNSRCLPFDEISYKKSKSELSQLKEKKKQYQETELYRDAVVRINDRMNVIVVKLDFEHKPPELNFELNPNKEDNYKLFQKTLDDEKIFLRQMGSASNALACHLGLFLSFMNYFSIQKDSKVPSILFLDQPSQVYFPSGKDNTDIEKVGEIYSTLLHEIEDIEMNAGYIPQIIVADHIKDLGEGNIHLYEHYFKADWRDGNGLI